ncbi:AAA family ATPase [Kalamiella sp. sgz302252]|uniref:AAA family ATPase n=1 Tax=Pantoea sp. sgz302252 TaxID=3341827 RepID=UPI0036D3A7C5
MIRIYVYGASGTGTTTISRLIAEKCNIMHVDSDDIFWHSTKRPYQKIRAYEEQISEINARLLKHDSWVLAGSLELWKSQLEKHTTHMIFLTLSDNLRIDRILKREKDRFGDKINKDGELYEMHRSFIKWTKQYHNKTTKNSNFAMHLRWYENFMRKKTLINSDQPLTNILNRILLEMPEVTT